MAIDVVWGNDDHTVLVYQFHDSWTRTELKEAVVRSALLTLDRTEYIHIVFNMAADEGEPLAIFAQSILRSIIPLPHATGALIVFAGKKSFVQSMIFAYRVLVSSLTHYRAAYVTDSLEAALRLIEHHTDKRSARHAPQKPALV